MQFTPINFVHCLNKREGNHQMNVHSPWFDLKQSIKTEASPLLLRPLRRGGTYCMDTTGQKSNSKAERQLESSKSLACSMGRGFGCAGFRARNFGELWSGQMTRETLSWMVTWRPATREHTSGMLQFWKYERKKQINHYRIDPKQRLTDTSWQTRWNFSMSR